MALTILTSNEKPVNVPSKSKEQLKANQILLENFKGELSSVTGIQSKGMYIAKLHPISSEPERPTVTIISTNYIHTDSSKVRVAIGTYGKSWIKRRFIECDENEQAES